jgi:hypothetical protein
MFALFERTFSFAELRKFYVRKSQKYRVRDSQIRKLSHLRKDRKSNKLFKVRNFADLQFAEVICGPPIFAAPL